MVGVVIVSHSKILAEGVVDVTRMMAEDCPIAAAGGLEDGTFGTSFDKIMTAIEEVYSEDGVAVLMDMGSAVMTTEMVLEMLPYDNVKMVDCPIAEGAVAATIASVGGETLEAVIEQAEQARDLKKF